MRYAWLGSTRKKVVRDLVSSCTAAWLQNWCLQSAEIDIDVSEHPDLPMRPDNHSIWLARADSGHLFVAMDERQLEALGDRFVLSTAQESDGMSRDLACAAIQDLAKTLAGNSKHASMRPVETWKEDWPESVCRPELGAMGLRITLDQIEVAVFMDRVVVDAMAPVRPQDPASLASRTDALDEIRVPLFAVLDFGPVAANELADLRVGEVLVSDTPVTSAVAVRTGNCHLFDANLVRRNGHLAVVAIFPSNQEVS